MSDTTGTHNTQTVNWDEMAHGFWGETPFASHMSLPEMNYLIGWANYQQDPRQSSGASWKPMTVLPNDPLPPSTLAFINQLAVQMLSGETEKTCSAVWNSYDTSALDALAVALDEMVTVLLLPLAERHVERCRKLESDSEAAFAAWTLPPDEALLAILREEQSTSANFPGLATTLPSQRFYPGNTSGNRPDRESPEKAIERWCRVNHLDRQFVKDNMDIFGLFISTRFHEPSL